VSVDPLIAAITPKSDWFIVLRPFVGGEDSANLVRGEVVNASGWGKDPQRLVELRYLATLPHGVAVPSVNEDGKRLIILSSQQENMVPKKKQPAKAQKERPTPTVSDRKQRT